MTSATGEARPRAGAAGGPSGRAGEREEGFTLIEILVVISIILGLAAVVMLASGAILSGTKTKAVRAQIQRIVLHIEAYYRITGHYPPDGIDSPVKNDQGTPLKGGAALEYALSHPFHYREMAAGVPRTSRHEPLMKFKEAELMPEDPDSPGVREIRDAFGEALHYDNLENGGYHPQRGEVHYPPLADSEHPEDVRTWPISQGGVESPGRGQGQAYDLWSHGEDGHEILPPEDRHRPVGTWNLSEE